MSRGAFIVIEGINGSGKTRMALRLARSLPGDARYTCEPYGATLNQWLAMSANASPEEAALAFAADRAFHVRHCIRPAVADGAHVICDRYVMSSYAYQQADGCDLDWLRAINRHAPEPDLTIYLAVPVLAAVARIEAREDRTVGEAEKLRLLRVSDAYDDLMERADGQRYRYLNANRDADAVAADVLAEVTRFLATWTGETPL